MDWNKRFKEVEETKSIEKANKLLDDLEKELEIFMDDYNKLNKINS